jgi:hypothetical protein
MIDLKAISQFAQLEYKLGDPERGKTLFEGIVDSHPKRFDLWSVYMDMEASQGAIQSLRYITSDHIQDIAHCIAGIYSIVSWPSR